MDIKKALSDIEFRNRENMVSHLPYDRETAFFKAIKSGSIEETHRLFKPFDSDGIAVLSDNRVQSLKYHLVITIAFITRYCIEGGMEMETAYNLSDIYIRRVDKCSTGAEIDAIHVELVDAYVHRMNALSKKALFSKPVMQCIDYIYDNLHSDISLDALCACCSLSRSYLSRLFHKEVGVTVAQYIAEKRIDAAKNLLEFSDFSVSDISNYLCFSSESHFISVFKKFAKMTPREYKNENFRKRK